MSIGNGKNKLDLFVLTKTLLNVQRYRYCFTIGSACRLENMIYVIEPAEKKFKSHHWKKLTA